MFPFIVAFGAGMCTAIGFLFAFHEEYESRFSLIKNILTLQEKRLSSAEKSIYDLSLQITHANHRVSSLLAREKRHANRRVKRQAAVSTQVPSVNRSDDE